MYLLSIEHPHWYKYSHAPAIVTSWSGRQRSKHGDVTYLSRATCDVYGRNLDIKMQHKCYEKCILLIYKNSKCKELILHSFIQQSCFTMILPLAVSSPNNVLIRYDNQLPVVQQYFKNIAAIQNMGVLWKIWLYKILGVYYWYLKIPQCWYMEQGLKDIAFYVQKHVAP